MILILLSTEKFLFACFIQDLYMHMGGKGQVSRLLFHPTHIANLPSINNSCLPSLLFIAVLKLHKAGTTFNK
jgi:hypothetical protein